MDEFKDVNGEHELGEIIKHIDSDGEPIEDPVEISASQDNQEVIEALSKDDAEKLTKDIQATTTALYILLKRAHDTKAWLSLGYKSWTDYIESEFEFSRARSYQLINQANVIEAIDDASGVPLYITEREARDIKKRLPEITQILEKDVKDQDLSDEEAEAKTREIIDNEENKEDIDNASNFESNSHADSDEQEGEDDNSMYTPSNAQLNANLSEDDKFYYDNLIVTLKIFESMPNATLFGEKVKNSSENKKELIKLAESSFSWITQLLDEIE